MFTASRKITPSVVLCTSVNTCHIHFLNPFKIKESVLYVVFPVKAYNSLTSSPCPSGGCRFEILCNFFELVFTLCHKCDRYNCLLFKKNAKPRRKQLHH